MKNSHVCIVIINWNGYEDTCVCLDSLENVHYPAYSVIVVDNGSVDGSEAKLRQRYPQHLILQTGSNLGFAGGVNYGIRHALGQEADYVLLLNNDTRVEPSFLQALVSRADSDESAGIISGQIYHMCPPNRLWAYGGSFNANTGIASHYLCADDVQKLLKEPWYFYIPACLWLMRMECIKSVGFLSEKYFHLGEDVEYCIRVIKGGWKLNMTSEAAIYHKGSASLSNLNPVYHYYNYRNRLYLIREYHQAHRRIWQKAVDYSALLGAVMLSIFYARTPWEIFRNAQFISMAFYDFSRGRAGKRF